MSSLMDKLDHTAAVKEDIRSAINTLNGSQVVSTSTPFDQYSQYIKNKDWGFLCTWATSLKSDDSYKKLRLIECPITTENLDIGNYSRLYIWSLRNINHGYTFQSWDPSPYGYSGSMSPQRTGNYTQDIFDDNIKGANFCTLYNLVYNADDDNNGEQRIDYYKGSLNDGSSKYPGEDSSKYNCYWRTIDTEMNSRGNNINLVNNFFKKITLTKGTEYGEDEYLLTIPNYKVTLFNPYTQSNFQKEVLFHSDIYCVLGII